MNSACHEEFEMRGARLFGWMAGVRDPLAEIFAG
jgi:hypothetical protein